MPNITKLQHEKLLAAIDSKAADVRMARDVAERASKRAEASDRDVVLLREENMRLTRASNGLATALSKVAARDETIKDAIDKVTPGEDEPIAKKTMKRSKGKGDAEG